jgi:hypothetical protein
MRDVLATLAILGLGIGFLLPARGLADDKASERTKCSNNLKQIALAAIQYTDDKRFFPHIAKITELDKKGDTTPAGNDVPPRCLRSLVYFNYIDSPGVFACPSSGKAPKEVSEAVKNDTKKFGWDGSTPEQTKVGPITCADKKDGDADALTDLQYSWTVRGLTANAQSTNLLSGDRARKCGARTKQKIDGNHEEGWSVVYLDAHTGWVKSSDEDAKVLASTDKDKKGKFLVCWDAANCGDEVKKDEKKGDEKK